jgi:hypothetical protein
VVATVEDRTARGTYLTDGVSLFQVIDATDGQVLLQDCVTETLDWWKVPKVVRNLTVVRPHLAAVS